MRKVLGIFGEYLGKDSGNLSVAALGISRDSGSSSTEILGFSEHGSGYLSRDSVILSAENLWVLRRLCASLGKCLGKFSYPLLFHGFPRSVMWTLKIISKYHKCTKITLVLSYCHLTTNSYPVRKTLKTFWICIPECPFGLNGTVSNCLKKNFTIFFPNNSDRSVGLATFQVEVFKEEVAYKRVWLYKQ